MARLRFPGRPGYRFDRIGIRYGADEASKTTDPTLAIVASIHKGLQRFRDLFGDSDEDDFEFEGFSEIEVRSAESKLKHAIEQERQHQKEQVEEIKLRAERSHATLASWAAPSTVTSATKFRKTFNKIVETGLVVESSKKFKKDNVKEFIQSEIEPPKLNGTSNHQDKSVKHVKLKTVDSQPLESSKKVVTASVACDSSNGFQEAVFGGALFGSKPTCKYTAAKQILARATKQAALSSTKHLLASTHKVGKFVLPTKSSRSSRVIKPNKRFLEDDTIHDLVTKQPKIVSPLSPSSAPQQNSSIFSLGATDDRTSTFSPFQAHGLSLSPFNMNREKGFPAFSAAPQPSGTSSFTDGIGNQKPLGYLEQPLIVEGKRTRKPSLIMRMKLVEDNPDDEIKLQQQLSDTVTPVKISSSPVDVKPSPEQATVTPPSTLLKYGGTKSLIAPAKLFTGSSLSSQSLNLHKGGVQAPSQNTVVLRQPKLQLNRTALNRSKAALARSLKAQLKREAKLERKRRKSQANLGGLTSSVHSPGSSLAQLSPFSKRLGDSVIEKHKTGLFEGIEGAGSFSPASFSSPPATPSSAPKVQPEKTEEDFQASLIKEEDLLKMYVVGEKSICMVCLNTCTIKQNRKLPTVPLCKPCKKSYFFKVKSNKRYITTCANGGHCHVHYTVPKECKDCKYIKFRAVIKKALALGLPFKKVNTATTASKPLHYTKSRKRKKKLKCFRTYASDCSSTSTEDLKTETNAFIKKQRHKSDDSTYKHKNEDSVSSKSFSHKSSKYFSNVKVEADANSLDKPLSVDVGAADEPFSLSPPQTLSSTKSSPGRTNKALKKSATSFDTDSNEHGDDEDNKGSLDKPRGTSRGPRIKHVCRRAAMVFPHQRATFPEDAPQRTTLTLSALPTEEKQQLWAKTKSKNDEAPYSSDESFDNHSFPKLKSLRTLEEPCQEEVESLDQKIENEMEESHVLKKKAERPLENIEALANKVRKKKHASEIGVYDPLMPHKRKKRCRECRGCLTPDCGVCENCRDKPKFGGPGKIRKCCKESICLNPKNSRRVYAAFIDPKSPLKFHRNEDDDNSKDYFPCKGNLTTPGGPATRFQDRRSTSNHKMDGGRDGVKDEEEGMDADRNEEQNRSSSSSRLCGLDMDGSRMSLKAVANINKRHFRQAKSKYAPVETTIQMALTDIRNPFLSSLPGNLYGKLGIKKREKLILSLKQHSAELRPVNNETAYCLDVPLKTHLIKADYKGSYSITSAWFQGFSLTLTGTTCVRTLCYLCGSAGKQELIFCVVCCQAYHTFCLDEEERPEEPDSEEGEDAEDGHCHVAISRSLMWCCRRCQFCHVCGQQNGLLKCHRCKDTYHPECLGPNYPTRPSRKNIWVCTKCVRCKSCGATTPGVGSNATWTYDFSLCYDCGKLMDKGNFCPICHKCYSDDDWESKMVHCAICESWVHAKCEELTDDEYQLISLLPDEVQFTCRVCSSDKPRYWERVLKSQFSNNLMNILNALESSKCAQLLLEAGPPREIRKTKPNCTTFDDTKSNAGEPKDDAALISKEISVECSNDNVSVERNCDTVSNSGSLNTKLIEKCDCDGAVVISLKEDKIGGAAGGLNGIILDNCTGINYKNNSVHSDLSVIQTSSLTLPKASSTELLDTGPPSSFTNEEDRLKVQGLTLANGINAKKHCSIENAARDAHECQVIESVKITNCDINCLKHGMISIPSTASCDSLSPCSITSNSDSSSNTASPMMTAKASVSSTKELNENLTISTVCPDPCRQSVTKNLFQIYSSVSSMPKTCESTDLLNSVDMDLENNDLILHRNGIPEDGSPEKTSQTETTQTSFIGPSDFDKHVSFEFDIWETLDINGEHPRDFTAIKNKIETGSYTSVEEFSEDMVRIIQALLIQNENYSTRRKQANSVRSIFAKQMERCFPWFNVNTCKLWEHNRGLPVGMLKDAVLPPSSDHNYAQWLERKDTPMTPQPSQFKKISNLKKNNSIEDNFLFKKSLEVINQGEDTRACLLCTILGDDLPDNAGRLLYCGQDDWIHINCALWSAEVFESHDGSLQNVQDAVSRGRKLKCDLCQQVGATVGCCAANCRANYHFMCAKKDKCIFLADQTIFCKAHPEATDIEIVTEGHFDVSRRVCVDLEKIRAKSSWGKAVDPSTLSVIIGSCTVEHLGVLRSILSDTEECLYPIDFCSTRIYWSTQDTRKRCVYTCRIIEVKPAELPEIHIQDMRIIHDESNPEFVPLDKLGLDLLGIPNFLKPPSRPDLTSPVNASKEMFPDHVSETGFGDCDEDVKNDSHSNKSSQNSLLDKHSTKSIDLTGLSPSTLALLNIKVPENYIPPARLCKSSVLPPVEEELGLVRIAERLNNAASCKQRHSLGDKRQIPQKLLTSRNFTFSKSQSPSPVAFPHQIRQRSSSEERYSSPLSPLAHTNAVARVNLALPNGLWRGVRARSVSPFTTIRCEDVSPVRSVSLSPQPLLNLITCLEAKDLSDESPLCLTQGTSEAAEVSRQTIDCLEKTSFESSSANVLGEEAIKDVLVTNSGNMPEDPFMKPSLSALDNSSETNSVPLTRTVDERNCQDIEDLTKGDHFTRDNVNVKEKGVGDKDSHQDSAKNNRDEVRGESGHAQQSTNAGPSPVNHGSTDDGSGDDDERKPCRGGTKPEASEICSDKTKTGKTKKLKPKENAKQACVETDTNLKSDDESGMRPGENKLEVADTIRFGGAEEADADLDSKNSCNTGLKQCNLMLTGGGNGNLEDNNIQGDCEGKLDKAGTQENQDTSNMHLFQSSSTSVSCIPKSFLGDIQSTSDDESDFLMLDDLSYSETNDEDENNHSSKKLTLKTVQQELSNHGKNNESKEPLALVPLGKCRRESYTASLSDKAINSSKCDISPHVLNSESDKVNKIESPMLVTNSCYIALKKQNLPSAVHLNAKLRSGSKQTFVLKEPEHDTKYSQEAEDLESAETNLGKDLAQDYNADVKYKEIESNDQLIDLRGAIALNSEANKSFSELGNVPDVDSSSAATLSGGNSDRDEHDGAEKSVAVLRRPATDSENPLLDLDSSEDEPEIIKTEFFQSSVISPRTRASSRLSGTDESLHEKIVEKIKAESLARRSPGHEGPFKCLTCKRMYRTKESYENHIKSCDFEVSTSDEDEKPISKLLRSSTSRLSEGLNKSVDKSVPSSSPLNIPLSIIISDEFKEEKFSPSSGRELSDDCSSAQSQDSRRSSLRRSTMTQRNAAPAHLAKLRRRDSKSTLSPDGSTCSSLLSPTRCSSRLVEDKPSPKETMLEAVGLVSRKSLELSPHSDLDAVGPVKLQPRISPSSMDEAPKREKKSPAQACPGGNMRPSIMAGGLPKAGSSKQKSVTITYNPVVLEEVTISSRQKRPRPKRVWWVEASQDANYDQEEDDGNYEDEENADDDDSDGGVACRTRNRLSTDHKATDKKKSPKPNISSQKLPDINASTDNMIAESVSIAQESPLSNNITDQKTFQNNNHDGQFKSKATKNNSEMNKFDSSMDTNVEIASNVVETMACSEISNNDLDLNKNASSRKTFNLRSKTNKNQESSQCSTSLQSPMKKSDPTTLKHKGNTNLDSLEKGTTVSVSHSPCDMQAPVDICVNTGLSSVASHESKLDEPSIEKDEVCSNMDECSEQRGVVGDISTVTSPIRRSSRSASKKNKLSEYLAELKKEFKDEEEESVAETLPSADVKEKRGRGRPKLIEKQPVEALGIKKLRGRPLSTSKLQLEKPELRNSQEKGVLDLENVVEAKAQSSCDVELPSESIAKSMDSSDQKLELTLSEGSKQKSSVTVKQSEMSDASGDNKSDNQRDSSRSNSTATSLSVPIQVLGSSSSVSSSGTSVKDSDARDTPPSIHPAIDAIKFSGQKLRFIIRSPNIDAAQKIGELIKKKALASNAKASEIIVSTVESQKVESSDKVEPIVVSDQLGDDSHEAKLKAGFQEEVSGKALGTESVDSGDVSRSVSPDSISAAYDIQSDDFSSETSNDADDYPITRQSNNECTNNALISNKEHTEKVVEEEDDDVVIIKAVGLQAPEPSVALRPPQNIASNLLSGISNSFSSASTPKDMSPVLRYIPPQQQQPMSIQTNVHQTRFTQPSLSVSPVGQGISPYISLQQNQVSPPRVQPQVMLSGMSTGHFILQQNQRPDLIQPQEMTQSNLVLQNTPSQSRVIIQNSNQPGIVFRNTGPSTLSVPGANQPNMLFTNNSAGLMLQQANPASIMQAQSTLMQSSQTGLSFISLNNPNTIRPTIISTLQPIQSHNASSLLQPNMGLNSLMQTATLSAANQPVMIGQPFFAQTGVFLPQLATQATISTQPAGIELASRQLSPKPALRQSSIVIDPSAHMLSTNLNPALLKGNPQAVPSHIQLNRFDPSPSNPLHLPSPSLRLPPPTLPLPSSTSSVAPQSLSFISLPKTTPVLAHLDGAPTQVNYMGSFDLNSSTLQSVFQKQQFNKDQSDKITDLVQRAISSHGQESIPGVEVKSTITNTPEGPRKLYSVIINEGILPNQTMNSCSSSLSTLAPTYTSSVGTTPVTQRPQLAATEQKTSLSDWTKILPSSSSSSTVSSSSQTNISSQTSPDNLWSGSRTGYISIPINQNSNNTRPPFRRALKPNIYNHSNKRKSDLPPSEEPQLKRPLFDKTLKEDGVYSGSFKQVVSRNIIESTSFASCDTPNIPSFIQSNGEISSVQSKSPQVTCAEGALTSNEIPSDQQQPQQFHNKQLAPASTHRRASFPIMSPCKKSLAITNPASIIKERAKKQIMKKSLMKDVPSSVGIGFKTPETERITTVSRRLKTTSHHPLIHHKKDNVELPQPMLEEEVVATPLDQGKDMPGGTSAELEKVKHQSRLRFEISSDDGFTCQGDTVDDAWNQVLEKVQDVRAASRMKQLSYAGISGCNMFGLDHDAVVYLIEQLYGAVYCHRNYKFKFHKYDLDQADAEVTLNPSGAARSEAFSTRKPFDMFNFLKSVYRTRPGDDEREKEEEMALKSSRRATSLSLPMAMRFRKLKTFAKEAVDVYRSKIHGRGLFCKRNIDAGEMVIEYAGEVIRASLTDKREKYYESRGIGCYMFRIDDDEVVDATMHGSAARFINHSCEPNCFSKVILVDGKKHIVIFAMRPIKRGEELTYDYKFPIEEVKIPCSCGSKRCRKYLN
nr:histone-lysine N-methyltransferase 2A isoform X1 [Biomphalaria glabrata]